MIYKKAQAEVVEFDNSDIITTSSFDEENSIGKPGHGWGDSNHGHSGPPGQQGKR